MSGPDVERRSLPESGAQVDHDDDKTESTSARCWICGRALRAKTSVRLGIGPKCWTERMGGAK